MSRLLNATLAVCFVGSALLPLLPFASSLSGQLAVGADVGLGRSAYRELDDPVRVGLSAEMPVAERLAIQIRGGWGVDSQDWRRSVCSGLVAPGLACPDDDFEGSFTVTSLDATLLIRSPRFGPFGLLGGGGAGLYRVRGEWVGRESGTRVGVMPEDPYWGWTWQAGADYAVRPEIRVAVTARGNVLDFRACGADAYFPFCESHALTYVDLGIQWLVGEAAEGRRTP